MAFVVCSMVVKRSYHGFNMPLYRGCPGTGLGALGIQFTCHGALCYCSLSMAKSRVFKKSSFGVKIKRDLKQEAAVEIVQFLREKLVFLQLINPSGDRFQHWKKSF